MTVCLWEGCQKRPSESVNIEAASASHSESIPQSVCVPLTQCSLWTLSAVLFLSSQITAFQMGSSLWHGELAEQGGQRGLKYCFGKCTELDRVSAAECKEEALQVSQHTCTHKLGQPRCAHSHFAGISFKCQIIHLKQVTQTFRDLLRECQTQLWMCTKLSDKVQRPLAPHSEAWEEEVRHPGFRQLSHAALIECTCNLRLCFVSEITRSCLFCVSISWPGFLCNLEYCVQNDFLSHPPKHHKNRTPGESTFAKCHQTRLWYLLPLSGVCLTLTFK